MFSNLDPPPEVRHRAPNFHPLPWEHPHPLLDLAPPLQKNRICPDRMISLRVWVATEWRAEAGSIEAWGLRPVLP